MKSSLLMTFLSATLIAGIALIPLQGQVTPGSASTGTTNGGPTGNYPGSGSSITNAPTTPPGTTPGQASAGAIRTPPTGNYPGTGSGH
jgi:hypothetical protein